ncbi:DUF2182 domain-containing protein [Actibacterium sp. MT2.3-13A]|uniref:DUF2182 domain-containing protein n=1 Tax=Actibacterium sp. MT2.3-13A TaxID=2828332 RepID=UPI002012C3F3|nr:DUF2182 domain-containing protein [Actibacterium sp. MT2.3-13A]
MPLSTRIRAMRAPHWLLVFGLIVVGWTVLYAMSLPSDLRAAGRLYGAEFWRAICTVTPDAAGYGKLTLMWSAMAAAMMLPTLLPALATYEDLAASGAASGRGMLALVAGYLAVWLGFSALAAGVQMGLTGAGLVTPLGESAARWFSAALLAGAGAYQFTALKAACLSQCRQPLTFFMQYWRPGPGRAAAMGLRLGAVCLGCCWALMALAFVGGTMNLAWMGLATVLMVFEKLPGLGRVLTRPLGAALIGAAGLTAAGLI